MKVADIHSHPWILGNAIPTPGEGSLRMPDFVWPPALGGVNWQHKQTGYWGVYGATPPGFIPFPTSS
jgi:hypothetical protein